MTAGAIAASSPRAGHNARPIIHCTSAVLIYVNLHINACNLVKQQNLNTVQACRKPLGQEHSEKATNSSHLSKNRRFATQVDVCPQVTSQLQEAPLAPTGTSRVQAGMSSRDTSDSGRFAGNTETTFVVTAGL